MGTIRFAIALGAALGVAPSHALADGRLVVAQADLTCPARRYCTRVRSCREAVHLWCVCGYRRADADGDGVPCEKLCGQSSAENLERVARIRAELRCR